jgi:DNA mismatch repair protein MutS2
MLAYGRKSNELLNKFFQTKNKKELLSGFNKWATIEQAKNEKLKQGKINSKIRKNTGSENQPLSKRQTKEINKKVKLEEKKKLEALREIEKEILIKVKKISKKKEFIARKAAHEKSNYQFKIDDRVRLFDSNAKGTIEKIEKNIATINYGVFMAKTDVKKLELVQKSKKK